MTSTLPKTFKIAAAAAMASAALLIPAASAQAASPQHDYFCVIRNGANLGKGITLKPGQRCTLLNYSLPVHKLFSYFHVVKSGNYAGGVCGGITNPQGVPLDDSGRPTNWSNCYPVQYLHSPSDTGGVARAPQNVFGAVYGVATILNFSNATIKFVDWDRRNCTFENVLGNCVSYYA